MQLVQFSHTVWKCSPGDLSLTSHRRGLLTLRPPHYFAGSAGSELHKTILGSKNTQGDLFSSCGSLWSFTEINGLIEE